MKTHTHITTLLAFGLKRTFMVIRFIGLFSLAMSVSHADTDYRYQENWRDTASAITKQININKRNLSNNSIYQQNLIIGAIEKRKRPTDFVIKQNKTVDLYLRESYTILEDTYKIKNAPIWKKVLIEVKQEWDY